MNPILLTYLLGIPTVALTLGILNRKTKYITRYDIKTDASIIIFLFCVATILWPLALVISIIAGILYGYYRAFVPKD
jgi:Ca2+/H+ antiporter